MANKNAKGEWNQRHSTPPNLQQKWVITTSILKQHKRFNI